MFTMTATERQEALERLTKLELARESYQSIVMGTYEPIIMRAVSSSGLKKDGWTSKDLVINWVDGILKENGLLVEPQIDEIEIAIAAMVNKEKLEQDKGFDSVNVVYYNYLRPSGRE